MLQEYKNVIVKNFVALMKDCNVNVLKPLLVDKGVFTRSEISEIFSTSDPRHNKRVFFFNIQKKEQRAFNLLIKSLKETNQTSIADLLLPRRAGCTVFNNANDNDEIDDNLCTDIPIHINPKTTPLNIQVIPSTIFYDTNDRNRGIDCYYTRSKRRGRVLIINNFDFHPPSEHTYRNGAEVDNNNLQNMFRQMGGWEVEVHNNQTAERMKMIIKNFSQKLNNHQYDIFFIIIMSHGSQKSDETIIFGLDDQSITASSVQEQFTNVNCKVLRGKPKVFIFQMCRGNDIDCTIKHYITAPTSTAATTETDSVGIKNIPVHDPITIRSREDMLIGYSTLPGFIAHRDENRGSWYIELICEIIMKHAHDTPVDDLLMLVDQRLRRRMSEMNTMQTAEHRIKGFKKLYLHPGIYSEDEALKQF